MPPQADIPFTLLDRYLAGECTPDETIEVRQWLSRQPSHDGVLAQVRAIQHVVAHEPVWNTGVMWNRISPHITEDAGETAQQSVESYESDPVLNAAGTVGIARPARLSARSIGLHRTAWSAVAVIAVAIGAFFGAKTFSYGTGQQLVKQVAYHTVNTLQGQRAQFQLPDGSTVLLGPDTRLQYRSVAGRSERVIELYGEALFTVTHAERAPFIVRANGTTIRVLGTTFAVRKYNDELTARVVVAEGRVSVSSQSARQPVVLSTGEGAQIDGGTGAMTIDRAVNIRSALAWTQGRLDFTRTPFRTIIADVARMYDIELRIASPALANQLVTGAIDDRLSPSDALAMLAGMVGGRVERSGSGFIFTER